MILKLQEDKITAEAEVSVTHIMVMLRCIHVCAQARRHKEEAKQKVVELQLQLSHLSRLKDDKTTAVSDSTLIMSKF